jgi:hypothetical protein
MKGVPTEVYSRVVGYYRPVNQWNKGKQSEFAARKNYDVRNIGPLLEVDKTNRQG